MKSIPADRPFLPPVPGLTSTLERTPDSIRGIEQFERLEHFSSVGEPCTLERLFGALAWAEAKWNTKG